MTTNPKLRQFLERTPLTWVLVFLAGEAGFNPTEIYNHFARALLRIMMDHLESLLTQESLPRRNEYRAWFDLLRPRLNELLGAAKYPASIGDTTLSYHIEKQNRFTRAETVEYWVEAVKDNLLIAKFLDGDDNAFAELLMRYEERLRGRIRIQVDCDSDAQDCLSLTRIKIWKCLNQFDPAKGTFAAYANLIAKCVVLDWLDESENATGRFVPWPRHEGEYGDAEPPDLHEATPLEALVHAEDVSQLLRLLFFPQNPPHQLVAFILVKLLGIKPSDVVREFADQSLAELLEYTKSWFLERGFPRGSVHECFQLIGTRHGFKLTDENLRQHFPKIAGAPAQQMKAATKKIDGWIINVRKRITRSADDNQGLADAA
jgi:DNA-directed RNA polymerase specialized sigma24 family protein